MTRAPDAEEQRKRADALYERPSTSCARPGGADNATALQAIGGPGGARGDARLPRAGGQVGGALKPGRDHGQRPVLGAESGGALMAKLARLIPGAQERLPAGEPEATPEPAAPIVEAVAELVAAEPVP